MSVIYLYTKHFNSEVQPTLEKVNEGLYLNALLRTLSYGVMSLVRLLYNKRKFFSYPFQTWINIKVFPPQTNEFVW